MFFGPIGKTRWPPWPIRQKGGILYSGARYVALWASCFKLLKGVFLFQLAGCDGIIGSGTVKDRCGICNGDGSTCQLISGIFMRTHLPYGYNLITRIPAGACNINITEMGRSRNYLGNSYRSHAVSVCLSVRLGLSGIHTYLVVTRRYISLATCAIIPGMLPFWYRFRPDMPGVGSRAGQK